MYIFAYSNNSRILEGPNCYQWLPQVCGNGAECRRVGRSVCVHGRSYVGRYFYMLCLPLFMYLFIHFYNKDSFFFFFTTSAKVTLLEERKKISFGMQQAPRQALLFCTWWLSSPSRAQQSQPKAGQVLSSMFQTL